MLIDFDRPIKYRSSTITSSMISSSRIFLTQYMTSI